MNFTSIFFLEYGHLGRQCLWFVPNPFVINTCIARWNENQFKPSIIYVCLIFYPIEYLLKLKISSELFWLIGPLYTLSPWNINTQSSLIMVFEGAVSRMTGRGQTVGYVKAFGFVDHRFGWRKWNNLVFTKTQCSFLKIQYHLLR